MTNESLNPLFIYLGANEHKGLVDDLLLLDPDIRFIRSQILPEGSKDLINDDRYKEFFIYFDSKIPQKLGNIGLTALNGCNLIQIIDAVMGDKLIPLLWTRFGFQIRARNLSEVKRYEIAYSLIKSAIEVCTKNKPSAVVFSYEPHALPVYIFKKVCEALGIKTYTLISSPFIWRTFLEVNGDFYKLKHANKNTAVCNLTNKALIEKLINEKKSDYSIAKPFYEKQDDNKKIIGKLIYRLKTNHWKPRKVIQSYIENLRYNRFSEKRSSFEEKKYVCVFLHFQPEMTTLPDGDLFAHQLMAIQMLYTALSSLDISLVVREHPSTFKYAYEPKWRPKNFYETIKQIGPNIYFDSIDEEPYSLVRGSIGVASITGTILLETLLLGRPAIAFGRHSLRGLNIPGFVADFKDDIQLRDGLLTAINQEPKAIIEGIEAYMSGIYCKTFGPNEYLGNENMTADVLTKTRYLALRQVIELMKNEGL